MRVLQNEISVLFLICSITASPVKEGEHSAAARAGNAQAVAFLTLNPEEVASEGDILLNPTLGRSGVKNKTLMWPKGFIPYVLDSSYNYTQRDLIMTAMHEIHMESCLRFVPRTTESDYISIENKNGCKSHIGRIGNRQVLYLQVPLCFNKLGTVLHQLVHVLGFVHEHQRPDRDKYVTVHMDHIKSTYEKDFKKADESLANTYGLPYDYYSITHYSEFAGTSQGFGTIVPLTNVVGGIGQRRQISDSDILKMNFMYDCSCMIERWGERRLPPMIQPEPEKPKGSIDVQLKVKVGDVTKNA